MIRKPAAPLMPTTRARHPGAAGPGNVPAPRHPVIEISVIER